MFKAEIIADSTNEFGQRLTTFIITFPRMILAELNTHRMLSKNSASSRAIPYKKALKLVIENPFIPIAFQKNHSGMQGTENLDMNKEYSFEEIRSVLHDLLVENFKDEDGNWDKDWTEIDKILNYQVLPLLNNGEKITIKGWWLKIRDLVVSASVILAAFGVTKQICNRLLEPFMWHTVIITGSEWENFFALRASYAAEIHMQRISFLMLEAYNSSYPKPLKEGEWHLPFGSNINQEKLENLIGYNLDGSETSDEMFKEEVEMAKVKIAIARCAGVSYTIVGEDGVEEDYQKLINRHDKLLTSGHWSPFEHVAQAMSKDQYYKSVKGEFTNYTNTAVQMTTIHCNSNSSNFGWSGNFRGFAQYRKFQPNENQTDERVLKTW